MILYKEWIKTRWALLIVVMVWAGALAYSFIGIATDLRLTGAGAVWESIVQKGTTYFGLLHWLPLLTGVFVAIAQYAPEVTNKRLKLTLHLPLPEARIMLTMLGYGVAVLAALFGLAAAVAGGGAAAYFPAEIVRWNLVYIHPWLWGGLAAYLLTTWVCIEPVWRQRLFDALVAGCLLALFYFRETPGAYTPFVPYLIAVTAAGGGLIFYSLIRFKEGQQ